MNPKYLSTQFISKATLYLSIGLFLVALTQPCYCTISGCGGSMEGLFYLLCGLFAFDLSSGGFTWLANPILIVAWLTYNSKPKTSLIASFLSATISTSFLMFKNVMLNEAGSMGAIMGYRLGYWLWLSSCWVNLIGNLVVLYLNFKIKGNWSFLKDNKKTYDPVIDKK